MYQPSRTALRDRRAAATYGRWLRLAAFPGLVASLAIWAAAGSAMSQVAPLASPDPITCDGYPEKRVYLENQSWLKPQLGLASHPGTGTQGHIHIGTCFPLFQRLTADYLSLDILVQLHNFPGRVKNIGVQANPIPKAARVEFVPEWRCPTSDCSRWIHMELPLKDIERSGWMPFLFKVNTFMADGSHWHTLTGWQANVQNGKPPLGTGTPWLRVRGDTWLENTTPGGSKYSTANIDKAEFPWNATTGEPIPKSGIWRPTVFFQGMKFGQVLIDPALHANPPKLGLEVYKGPHRWQTLTIDTTRLTNGRHRMLLISCHNHDSGRENCGVLAVPFIVQNKTAPRHSGLLRLPRRLHLHSRPARLG